MFERIDYASDFNKIVSLSLLDESHLTVCEKETALDILLDQDYFHALFDRLDPASDFELLGKRHEIENKMYINSLNYFQQQAVLKVLFNGYKEIY